MKTRCCLVVLSSFLFYFGYGQQGPQPVESVMQEALQRGAKENKNVLIIFHASWCGWCRKMDSSLNDKTCKHFFENNYVIRHLVAYESADKKNFENPGVYQFLAKYNSENIGLPSWLVFDKDGNLLADSQIRPAGASMSTKGENVGCPATREEVGYFIKVLQTTSHVEPSQLAAIEKRFLQNGD